MFLNKGIILEVISNPGGKDIIKPHIHGLNNFEIVEILQTSLDKAIEAEKQRASLKSMIYAEYLKTDHWQNLKKFMLWKYNGCCQLCNSDKELNVHHRTYERRGEETEEDLILLCRGCHAKFHDKLENAVYIVR